MLALADTDPAGWTGTTLDVVVEDSIKKRNLGIFLRVDARFEGDRLPVKIHSRAPSGAWTTDSLTLHLRVSGNDIKETIHPWRREVVFPHKGVYTFTITGAETKGIRAIGVIEEK